jgi:hypothetical protein
LCDDLLFAHRRVDVAAACCKRRAR